MTKSRFLEGLADVLMEDPAHLTSDTPLAALRGWDSMGQVATIAYLDEVLATQLPPGTLQNCRTVDDIMQLVAPNLKD